MEKKAQIQELISLGKTEEALELLEQLTTDAVLLQARFNGAKRQYSMGMIDFSEWSRTQAQINYAALEMMNSVRGADNKNLQRNNGEPDIAKTEIKPKVFISYSWDDKLVVNEVKSYLEVNGCIVTIDDQNLEAGESISGFIQDSIKNNHFILSIVSQNSLSSGWVGRESTASFFAEWLADKQFIPARLDKSFNDPRFFVTTLRSIESKITELDEMINETQQMRADTGPLDMDRRKLLDLKAKLPDILTRLKSINTVPIDGDNFQNGMEKIMQKINKK